MASNDIKPIKTVRTIVLDPDSPKGWRYKIIKITKP